MATSTRAPNPIRWGWRIYYLLVLLRFIFVFSPGYIHPDAYFQTSEPMYELMMHSPTTNITDTTAAQPQRILLVQQQQQQEQTGHTQRYPHRSLLPWEWQPGHANRAVTPPLITVGLAIGPLMSLLDMCGYASSSAVLLVLERAVIASMTLLVDIAVYKGAISLFSGTDTDANAKNDSRREEEREQYGCMALLCLGSSWPALVMFSHPFSNTTETIVSSTVFLLFVTKILPLLRIHPQQQQQGQGSVIKAHNSQPLFPRLHYAILLGALLSVGVWTRFTFPVFALGPALAVLCVVVMVAEQQRWKSPSRETGAASTRALLDGVKWLIGVAIGALTTCAALILIDTIYYTGEFDWRNIVVTPLNNLLYNSNPANLALHGIHPRWTHALVNIPLMFGGPVPMLLAWHLAQVSARWFWSFWCRSHQKQPSRTAVSRQHQMQTIILYTTLLSMIAIPLLALSLAPHQEPRFLLPTILPLSILLASWMYKLRATNSMKSYRTVVSTWVLYNLVMCVVFGVLHQGGIIPSLLRIDRSVASTSVSATTPGQHSSPTPTATLLDACFGSSSFSDGGVLYNVVYAHTYMPPPHLLSTGTTTTATATEDSNIVVLHDMAGVSMNLLQTKLDTLHHTYRTKNNSDSSAEDNVKMQKKKKTRVCTLLVIPGSIELPTHLRDHLSLTDSVFPHLSMEDPPMMNHHTNTVKVVPADSTGRDTGESRSQPHSASQRRDFAQMITHVLEQLCLNIYVYK